MSLITPEVVTQRADLFITSLKKAFAGGLEIPSIKNAEADSPKEHRGGILVALGLKPAASFLCQVTYEYSINGQPDFTFLDIASQTGVDLKYDSRTDWCIWNPGQVGEIISSHPDIFKEIPIDPKNESQFTDYLEFLSESSKTFEQEIAAGLLHGVPLEAARRFALYYDHINSISVDLWHKARLTGAPITLIRAPQVEELGLNLHGEKKDFLYLAQTFGVNKLRLVDYVEHMRKADVPGSGFITYKDVTANEEAEISKLYQNSKIDQKLREALAFN